MCSFRGTYANRGNGTELSSSDVVPVVGLEPTRGISPTDFESVTSTIPSHRLFENRRRRICGDFGAGCEIRTRDLMITNQALYRLS